MTGDTQRLDEAFLGMQQSLYRAILRIVRDAGEAEELTHDAYLRARRALDQNTPGNIEGFLWQTARNLALDHLRRRKVRSLHEQSDFADADAVVGEDVVGARRTGGSHRIGEGMGIDQHQLRQAHGLHGPGRRTDIAGMTGSGEDDTHAPKRVIVVHIKIWGFPN